jgi:alpha-tubulin suppressor-like RCC1 family protein
LNISVFAFLSLLCAPSVRADSIQLTANSKSPIISIWGGAREAIALKQDGSVWTWGHNVGEIGNGNQIDQALPFQVRGPGGVGTLNSVKLIMGGEDSNAAVTSDGSLWTWGMNGQGQLGIGSQTNVFTPVKVPTLNSVISLGGRARHYLSIKSDGTVWGWGHNLHGALGSACSISPCLATTPVLIPGVNNPIMVTAGQGFSAALLQDHTVMTWGST